MIRISIIEIHCFIEYFVVCVCVLLVIQKKKKLWRIKNEKEKETLKTKSVSYSNDVINSIIFRIADTNFYPFFPCFLLFLSLPSSLFKFTIFECYSNFKCSVIYVYFFSFIQRWLFFDSFTLFFFVCLCHLTQKWIQSIFLLLLNSF